MKSHFMVGLTKTSPLKKTIRCGVFKHVLRVRKLQASSRRLSLSSGAGAVYSRISCHVVVIFGCQRRSEDQISTWFRYCRWINENLVYFPGRCGPVWSAMAGGITDTGEPYSAFVSILRFFRWIFFCFIRVQLLNINHDYSLWWNFANFMLVYAKTRHT